MKLYGGQGPVSETATPDPSRPRACVRSAARNAAVFATGTRNAASSNNRDPGAARSRLVRRSASVASRDIAL